MKDDSIQSPPPERRFGAKRVLLEAVLVAGVGAGIAFAANEISPRGLRLSHNYFSGGTKGSVPKPIIHGLTNTVAGTNQPSPAEMQAARLKADGLQSVDYTRLVKLFHDPRFQRQIVFVDARNDADYQAGHIPGAYQFDQNRFDECLLALLPVCQAAEQIVVYCMGGDCIDSESVAKTLNRGAGIPNERLFIYPGGFPEWTTNNLPVETGARNSGKLRNPSK